MKKQQGATLIELMIASMLGLILSSVSLNAVYSSMSSLKLKSALEKMHEDSSLALYFLARDIRPLGFSGCMQEKAPNYLSTQIIGTFINQYGYVASNTNDYKKSDSITFVTALGEGINLKNDMSTVHSDLVLNHATHIKIETEIYITDCIDADLFAVSDIWNKSLEHDLSVNSDENLSTQYSKGAHLYPFSLISYKLAKGVSGKIGLYRKSNKVNFQELVPNVKGLKISYGMRAQSGALIYKKTIHKEGQHNLESVRVNLLLSSNSEVLIKPMTYTDLENREVIAEDLRFYKTYTLTIPLKNTLVSHEES